jgi:hypothetical protein
MPSHPASTRFLCRARRLAIRIITKGKTTKGKRGCAKIESLFTRRIE